MYNIILILVCPYISIQLFDIPVVIAKSLSVYATIQFIKGIKGDEVGNILHAVCSFYWYRN